MAPVSLEFWRARVRGKQNEDNYFPMTPSFTKPRFFLKGAADRSSSPGQTAADTAQAIAV
jgi:hypothetical protein